MVYGEGTEATLSPYVVCALRIYSPPSRAASGSLGDANVIGSESDIGA